MESSTRVPFAAGTSPPGRALGGGPRAGTTAKGLALDVRTVVRVTQWEVRQPIQLAELQPRRL